MKNKSGISLWDCLFLFMVLVMILLASCTSTKQVSKQNKSVDSSSIRKADSLSLVITRMKQTHARELQEARRTSVVFKDTPCPDVHIPDDCPKDSLTRLVQQQASLIKSFQNKVTQLANGSITYEGQIQSVTADLQRLQQENTVLVKDNISLIHQREDLTVHLKKAEEEIAKLKKTKTSVLNWWYLFLLGFIAGVIAYHKFKTKK